jgi:excisionase family DNA binding protein
MSVKELELISAEENEKPALQKMEGALNREIYSLQSVDCPFLRLTEPNGESLEIPMSVFRVLKRIVEYMAQGKAFSVIPYDQTMSTQDAADFLNVSRPYVVRLLEAGEIPFTKVGTHRRIQFGHLLEYQKRRSQERRQALAEMLEISQETGTY